MGLNLDWNRLAIQFPRNYPPRGVRAERAASAFRPPKLWARSLARLKTLMALVGPARTAGSIAGAGLGSKFNVIVAPIVA